jgi:hypothetical protein
MSMDNVPRCRHVKANGTQCGSPALRRRRFCYFHTEVRKRQAAIAADHFGHCYFDFPVLEDANAVQIALMQVLQMLGRGRLDHKTAGLLLYGLQTASANLRYADFEVEEATDVVIDCDTVDATCLGGPQWFEEDFEVQEDDQEDDQEEDEEEGNEVGELDGVVAAAGKLEGGELASGEPVNVDGREAAEVGAQASAQAMQKETRKVTKKKEKQVTVEEARRAVQQIARNFLFDVATAETRAEPG